MGKTKINGIYYEPNNVECEIEEWSHPKKSCGIRWVKAKFEESNVRLCTYTWNSNTRKLSIYMTTTQRYNVKPASRNILFSFELEWFDENNWKRLNLD